MCVEVLDPGGVPRKTPAPQLLDVLQTSVTRSFSRDVLVLALWARGLVEDLFSHATMSAVP